MAGPDIICGSKTKAAEEVLKVVALDGKHFHSNVNYKCSNLQRMEKEATFQYQILRVPHLEAANCLYINGTLIHCSAKQYPDSAKVFDEMNCETLELNISEIAKANGALTCCSILIRKPKHLKSL